jgi:PAS domain S-box-containing protein
MRDGLLISLGILFSVAVTVFVWRHRRALFACADRRAKQDQSDAVSKYRTILYSIGDAVITTDSQGRVMQLNPTAETLCGWKETEAQGRPLEEIFHIVNEETRATVQSPVRLVLREGKVTGLANHTVLLARDGKEYPISDSAAPISDERGRVTGVVLVFKDQTAERAAQSALRKSERRLKTLIENVPGIVYRCGRDTYWTMQFLSSNCKELTGYEAADLIDNKRLSFFDLIHPDDRQMVWDAVDAAAKRDTPYTLEYRIVTADGSVKWVWGRGRAVRDPEDAQETLEGVIHDITERKQAAEEQAALTEQLHQAQKLEALGRMAGGVAHDFNNALAVIIGNAELMNEPDSSETERQQSLQAILTAGEHAADLVRRLLGFASKQTFLPRGIDLNEAIGGMRGTLARLLGPRITFEWRPGPGLWPVLADPNQLAQILVNLAENAREAIAGDGTVTIETRNVGPDEAPDIAPEDEYVCLSVRDTGCGMDAETQSKIFEPFFTSKPAGVGTGMGLPIVYGIVKQNKGIIRVSSQSGQGSCFRIYLPRHRTGGKKPAPEPRSAAAPLPRISSPEPSPSAARTILLVEDEPALLELTRKFLTLMGYTVLSAREPAEALRMARGHAGEIHLLLTDLIMPNMNGVALWETLARERPTMRHLFMSGFTADVISHHGMLTGNTPFLQKPFTRETLAAKVREVLSS